MRNIFAIGSMLALLALLAVPLAVRAETKLEIYGTAHVSADYVDRDMSSIHNDKTVACTSAGPGQTNGDCVNNAPYTQLSSNLSLLGFRVTHDIGDSGMKALFQIETQVDVTATPGIKDSLGSRDTYIGLGTGAGAFKVGKGDSPYKKATSAFDPFSATVGDYNAIMGNTGGDNRAEFDLRLPHAAWWESPNMGGMHVAFMAAPGQNRVQDFDPNGTGDAGRNSGFPQGENNCSGSSPGGSGTLTLGGISDGKPGPFRCTDGSFGDAYSVSLAVKAGVINAIAAYELHMGVNRHGDDSNTDPGVGIHDESATKVGAQFVTDTTTLSAIYESMDRDRSGKGTAKEASKLDERTRTGYYLSGVQKVGDGGNVMLAWAHADKTPGDPVAQKSIDNEANLYSLGYRKFLDKSFSVYAVYAMTANNKGAHYDLGASGHGIPIVGRDGTSNCAGGDGCLPTDNNGVVKATNISSFSVGVVYSFSAPFEVSVAAK